MPIAGLTRTSFLFGMAVLAFPSGSFAQAVPGTPYTRFEDPVPYESLSSPTPLITQNGCCSNTVVQLPFPFKFYDDTVTEMNIGISGALTFTSGDVISAGNYIPGNSSFVDGFIAPFWDTLYLVTAAGSSLDTQITGNAPNRTVSYEWKNMSHDFDNSPDERYDFKVTLHEGLSGRIDIEYGPRVGSPFVSATMGMEDLAGGSPIFFSPSNCTTSCNNTHFDALQGTRITLLQDPGIELVALGVQAPQFQSLGVDTMIPVQLANLHGTAIGPFTVDVGVSADQDGANPTSIGSLAISLGPYQQQTVMIPTNAAVALGEQSYYMVLNVDATGAVNEVEENNNILVSDNRVRFLPALPDFEIQRVSTDLTMVSAGADVTVFSRIRNRGAQPITGGEVAIMMSTNTAITPQDVELVRFNVDLDPGQTVNATTTVTIPGGTNSGTYWLGTLADPSQSITEVSEVNNGVAALTSLGIAGGNLAILTTALPGGIVGQTYVAILQAAGGSGQVDWTQTAGMLPPGIGLVSATGEFFGRPQNEGVFTFTVQADSDGQTATQELTMTVSDPDAPLTVVTRAVPSGVVGQEYVFQLRATGGSVTSSLSWAANNLPDGIMISGDGILSGSPVATGTTTVEVTVTNGTETASRNVVLTINDNANLQIVPTILPPGTYNQPYSATIEATGGVPPIAFTRQNLDIPDGLELSTDGTLSGTPTEVGRFRLVIKASDSGAGGLSAEDTNTFELTINDDGGFVISTESLPLAYVDEGYTATIEAMGIQPLDWSLAEGRLPNGMIAQVDQSSGNFTIVGASAEEGVTNLLVRVQDANGRVAEKAFALKVLVRPVTVDPEEDDGGCGCAATGSDQTGAGALALLALLGLVLVRRRR